MAVPPVAHQGMEDSAKDNSHADAGLQMIATPQRSVRQAPGSIRHSDGTASPALADLARRSRKLQADFNSIRQEELPPPTEQSRSRSRGRGRRAADGIVGTATTRNADESASSSSRAPGWPAYKASHPQSSRSRRAPATPAPATPATPLTPAIRRLINSEKSKLSSVRGPSTSSRGRREPAKRARAAPDDADASVLQEEIERLRRENIRLKQNQADREEMRAAFEEIDKLRRRNEVLENGEQRSNDPGTLEPRGHGTHFNIHIWEVERRSQKGATASEEGVIAIVPTESAAGEPQPQSNIEAVQREPAVPVAVTAQLDSLLQPWILHHNLASAASPGQGLQLRIHPLLSDLQADVLSGRQDELTSKLTDVFRKHLEDLDRPYLALSASIPSLFGMLCRAHKLASGADSISNTDETVNAGHPGCKYAQCAALIRHLMNTSQFGEKPPARRPENITRVAFVRELCAQVGLSLDLARIAFAQRRELRAAAETLQRAEEPATAARDVPQLRLQDTPTEVSSIQEAITPVPLESGTEIQQDIDEQVPDSQISQSCASTAGSASLASGRSCVDRTELKAVLARAGRYMAAMQMDMERLHDEHSARQRSIVAAPGRLEEKVESAEPEAGQGVLATAEALAIMTEAEQLEREPDACELAHDLDDEASMSQLPLDFPSVSSEQVRSLVAAASTEPLLQESAVAGLEFLAAKPTPADVAVLDDPLVMPSFGNFLNEQLLPLYVGDVPFDSLKHLIDSYCGIPMDSDDEQKAWKVLGRPMPKRKARPTQAHKEKKQPSHESVAGDKTGNLTSSSGIAATERADVLSAGDPSPGRAPHQDLSLSDRSLRRRASAEAVPFSQLRQAIEKPPTMGPPKMRAQMLTSVVEKRRTDHAAPANMTASARAVRQRTRSSSSLYPQAPTPGIKPSLALLNTPCDDGLGTPASDRKAAWRQLEDNPAAATSTRKPRSDNGLLVRSSPAPAPNWGLLDTPAKPRPPGEEV